MRRFSVILQMVLFAVFVFTVHADTNFAAPGTTVPFLLGTNGSAAEDPLGENEPALSFRASVTGYYGPLAMVFVGQMDLGPPGHGSPNANIHGPPLLGARYALCHRLLRLLSLRLAAAAPFQRFSRRTLNTTLVFLRSPYTRIESHCHPWKSVGMTLLLVAGIRLFRVLDPVRHALSLLLTRSEIDQSQCLGCQLQSNVLVAGSRLESRLTPLLL
jgi:hypothetical protein